MLDSQSLVFDDDLLDDQPDDLLSLKDIQVLGRAVQDG
jgi:hypothetical protein